VEYGHLTVVFLLLFDARKQLSSKTGALYIICSSYWQVIKLKLMSKEQKLSAVRF
jgi:hypothetical protein